MEWFVMRDLTRPNALLPAWKRLGADGFEVFTPMVWKVMQRGRKRSRVQTPLIHDLLFVHSDREALDPKVARIPTLQYRFLKGAGYCQPMTVDEKEMERFMLAVANDKSPRFYAPGEITDSMIGRKVRIVGGPLNGFTGNLLSVKGMRTKRLIISLSGMFSAAVEVENDFIEFIK